MVDPKKVSSEDWSFQKVFGDADFMAAGVLVIPPQGRKSSKPSKDNTYVSSTSLSRVASILIPLC